MPLTHLALALAVMIIWGANFSAMRWALDFIPPLQFTALRFVFAALPAVFLFPRPRIPLRMLLAYGLFAYCLQFGLVFTAIRLGMPAGMASLVMQGQVFFTLTIAMTLTRERPRAYQLWGAALAAAGMIYVGYRLQLSMPLAAFLVTVVASASWGIGNTIVRAMGPVDALGLTAWGSLVTALVMTPLSLVVDGPAAWVAVVGMVMRPEPKLIAGVLFNSYISTVLCYAGWWWLLRRHPAALIAPFTLTVPIFGMLTAAIVLGEPMAPWKLAGAAVVLAGLAINQFGDLPGRLITAAARRRP